jgi:hypothetical protein
LTEIGCSIVLEKSAISGREKGSTFMFTILTEEKKREEYEELKEEQKNHSEEKSGSCLILATRPKPRSKPR